MEGPSSPLYSELTHTYPYHLPGSSFYSVNNRLYINVFSNAFVRWVWISSLRDADYLNLHQHYCISQDEHKFQDLLSRLVW